MELGGASALVVGGAGGLGTGAVRELAAACMHVVIADLAEEAGAALADELGPAASFVKTDVTDEDSVRNAVAIAAQNGPLRVAVVVHAGPVAKARVVNRAGESYPVADFRRTIEIFLVGTFTVMSRAAEQMATNEPLESGQRGVVVTTASIAGFEGQVGQSDYSAAKGGVIGMTLTAARDLAPIGIRVVSIAPGTFYTPAYRLTEAEAQEKWGPMVPNPKRMGRAAEYGHLTRTVAENDYLNGEVIRIDGAQRFS
jgi:NAD(P)-dependent dehydrogenase (short-subunit alcohol dehydrogenase family)